MSDTPVLTPAEPSPVIKDREFLDSVIRDCFEPYRLILAALGARLDQLDSHMSKSLWGQLT